jgi:hypothetical protein
MFTQPLPTHPPYFQVLRACFPLLRSNETKNAIDELRTVLLRRKEWEDAQEEEEDDDEGDEVGKSALFDAW